MRATHELRLAAGADPESDAGVRGALVGSLGAGGATGSVTEGGVGLP